MHESQFQTLIFQSEYKCKVHESQFQTLFVQSEYKGAFSLFLLGALGLKRFHALYGRKRTDYILVMALPLFRMFGCAC